MRQVPNGFQHQYGLLGNGRVARHIAAYFDALGISYWKWTEPRTLRPAFFEQLQLTRRLLVLVSDRAIAPVASTLPSIENQLRVHFSAATRVAGIECAHPLMTFGSEFYSLREYQNIPFALAAECPWSLSDLLPELPNPSFRVPQEKMALYHALCVASGNFPALFWQDVLDLWKKELGLQPNILAPFLKKTLENSLREPQEAPTGPITRGDQGTLNRHREAFSELGSGNGATERLRALHAEFVRLYGPGGSS